MEKIINTAALKEYIEMSLAAGFNIYDIEDFIDEKVDDIINEVMSNFRSAR